MSASMKKTKSSVTFVVSSQCLMLPGLLYGTYESPRSACFRVAERVRQRGEKFELFIVVGEAARASPRHGHT